ncbi:thymocyte nuclear protein 1-like [Chrysoperla carnea]|uniref:thymocyte nuclear protein 1-like n=1 Tax=Chrysoperla carnea TaxID=189513 RepID=UPI001D093FEE|nr:thymocyte nuclear protein 1-like [Chrysoperla carnea]
MQYWLFKSEPSAYSWQQMEKEKVTKWDGVRNYQAQKYMKTMKVGDLGFFYHSVKGKAIVGIVEVCKEHYCDDGSKFGQVDVKFSKPLSNHVQLSDLKQNSLLKNMAMLKQSRLSVSPVSENEWDEIIRMSKCESEK